jgi:type II secretion system protein H
MRTTSATGSRTGFTLIELSVVVFIIALVLAVAAPRFVRAYHVQLLNDAARTFATTCQYARIQAVAQQRPATVHVDVDRQRFWLTQELTPAEGEPGEHTLKAHELSPRVTLVRAEQPAAEEPDAKQAAVTFYPNGTCDEATVVFRGVDRNRGLAATLDPLTGKAAVYAVNL